MTTLADWLAHIDDEAERRTVVDLAARVHASDTATGRQPGADAATVDALLEDIRRRLAWSLRAKRHPLPGSAELRAAIRQHFDAKH